MKLFTITLYLFAFLKANAQFKVTILTKLPTTFNENLYVAGSLNNWNPKDEKFAFQKISIANWSCTIKNCPPTFSLKLTKGTWEQVECNEKGLDINNRDFAISSDTILVLDVKGFKDEFSNVYQKPQPSTASLQVSVIKDSFFIPQLNTKRRVWIYLPKNYDGKKRFPVLYMHDGQNLFDVNTSGYGEWKIDEYADSMLQQLIIVGIDHGGTKRLKEYNPYYNNNFGFEKPLGKEYAAFIATTLKKYIDKNYKTLKSKQNTFLAGSSMGGLISYYAAMQYPKTFGKIGVFSPAFWININELKIDIKKIKMLRKVDFYFYAGTKESNNLIKEVMDIYNLTKSKCTNCNLKLSIKADQQHNEKAWSNELPEFFNWLFQ